jgi:hypothetical protein
MMQRSDNASVRPNTSRMPSGEVTATIGGTSHLGPNVILEMGPPASRITSCPVSSVRTSFTNRRSGSGFRGANGSALTSVAVVTMAMRIVPHVPGRERRAPLGAPASVRTSKMCARQTKIGRSAAIRHARE